MREIFRQKERQTRIKRRTYTPTMSYKVAWHCYTHSETKTEKEIRIKRRTYTRRITDSILDTETDRAKERERNADQDTYLFTYNQWQYSRTLTETLRHKEREKHGSWDGNIHWPTISDNIAEHYYRYSERERKKNEKKDLEAYMHIQWVITYLDTGTDIQSQRDQKEVWIKRRMYTCSN